MRVGKFSKMGLQAGLITTLFGAATIASGEVPELVHRVGRLYGVGWGDGYHACSCSGLRILADLPPRSYASRYGARHHPAHCLVHREGTTFYDRFDAANGRCCDGTGGCDACQRGIHPCDAHPCDTQPCETHPSETHPCHTYYPDTYHYDTAPACESCSISSVDTRQGARVRQPDSGVEPDQPLTASKPAKRDVFHQAGVAQTPIPQTAAQQLEKQSTAGPVRLGLSDLGSEALTRIVSEPINKKYGIRPEPPATITARPSRLAIPSRPRGNSDVSMGFGLSTSEPTDPVTNQSLQPTFASSETPAPIRPVHPDKSQSTASGEPRRSSGSSHPLATGFVGESGPELNMPQAEVRPPATPSRSTSVASTVPSFAVEAPEVDEVAESSIHSLTPRPQRLGAKAAGVVSPDTSRQLPALVLRPKRLGGAGPVRVNPHASQSSVELVKRGPSSDDQVVRQPEGNTVNR